MKCATAIGSVTGAYGFHGAQAPVNLEDFFKMLSRASCLQPELAMLNSYLRAYPSLANAMNPATGTPALAYVMALNTAYQMCEGLIRFGADVNGLSRDGTPVLNTAVRQQKPDIVQLLLNYGADPRPKMAYYEYQVKRESTPITQQILGMLRAKAAELNAHQVPLPAWAQKK